MSNGKPTHQSRERPRRLSPQEEQERKERVLTQGTPSVAKIGADATVIKNGDIFFITDVNGSVPLGGEHGYGLYYHDCRYLHGYAFEMEEQSPEVLIADATAGFKATLEMTNPDIRCPDGRVFPKQSMGIRWERTLAGHELALYDVICFRNFSAMPVEFSFALIFQSAFEDVFAVRGLLPGQFGRVRDPVQQNGSLMFVYEGADHLFRSLTIHFSQAPQRTEETSAHFRVRLGAREKQELVVSLHVNESPEEAEVHPCRHTQLELHQLDELQRQEEFNWLKSFAKIDSDSRLLNDVMHRCLSDLRLLRTNLRDMRFFAAGVPWFVTLFGRDSTITALQLLGFMPNVAAETARLLALYQGEAEDSYRDEQPGKFPHELRVGEMAHLGEIPHTPYYGTVDTTPLFLMLVAEHAAWSGSLELFHELRGHVERALAWIDTYADTNHDGYIEYKSSSEKGLVNQGWKDSGDAIVNADGTLAEPPISLVEVQAYVYLAKSRIADLYQRAGDPQIAERLRAEARALQERFNRDFWLEDLGYYTLALEGHGQPLKVVSSNAGHALWTGIVDDDKAQRTIDRLMADDMFNGWGVRTLSSRECSYNPIGYHLGTVWPHDNAIITAGLRRYGRDEEALRIFDGILAAAARFRHYRLPEVFSGFARDEYPVPVPYPVADHPQAWAAASIPYMLQTLLGLQPDAFEHRLKIVRPLLPSDVDRLDMCGVRVGSASADLHFERRSHGVEVRSSVIKNHLEIVVED